MSQEDAIVSRIIESANSLNNTSVNVEVPYNHYGSRGVVDLVVEQTTPPDQSRLEETLKSNEYLTEDVAKRMLTSTYLWVYEVKSESAVNGATGANEIIRQFNSHREYFFRGSDYENTYTGVKWALAFEFTQPVFEHVEENEVIYGSLDEEEGVWIEWWHPEDSRLPGPFLDGRLVPYHHVQDAQDS